MLLYTTKAIPQNSASNNIICAFNFPLIKDYVAYYLCIYAIASLFTSFQIFSSQIIIHKQED